MGMKQWPRGTWKDHELLEKYNKNYSEVSPYNIRMAIQKNLKTINAGVGVEKREASYLVVGNVNWHSHYE